MHVVCSPRLAHQLQLTLLLAEGHKRRLLKRLEQGAHHDGPQPRHQLHQGWQGSKGAL